ncbi:MAG: hypothetical protein K8I27_03995 [Planctomycetes bacterium]|nr:hypothetical protein [Planctomycetota bacterium]
MADKAQPSPEVQLYARVRLQRVVFGAFAIVLVCLFALGLSAYRTMQVERDAARLAEADALARAARARNQSVATEKAKQQTEDELSVRERELALGKCRLAMLDVRDGKIARAAALLNDARGLGLPAWSPMIERMTRDATPRFTGSEHSDAPVVAGAVSGDGRVVAIARQTGAGIIVETWNAAGGEIIAAYPAASPAPDLTSRPARLLLSHDGSAWFLPLPEISFHGSEGGITPIHIDRWPRGVPLAAVTGDASLTTVHLAAGTLIRLERNAARQWGESAVSLGEHQSGVAALCMMEGRPVVATATGIYSIGISGALISLHEFTEAPGKVALHGGAGAVFAGVLYGREVRLLALSLGDQTHLATSRHEMPDEHCEDLLFLRDDSLVWTGRSGRAFTMSFAGKREWVLGGYTLSFMERHSQGLLFGNRRGEVSVRVLDESRDLGLSRHVVPPRFTPEARGHGFVMRAPDACLFVVRGHEVQSMGELLSAELAPQGPAWREGDTLRLPGGGVSHEQGVLLGAMRDGSVLLHDSPRKLKLVTPDGVIERLLPVDRVPETVVVAAGARVTAMRIRDDVYVTDFRADPEPVGGRLEASPDLLALDATGTRLAIAYGATVLVQAVSDESTYTLRTATSPRQIALLFEGTVLVTIETGALVFYEVETGRELTRAGTEVTSIAASGTRSLNIVASNRLHELSWD